MVTHTRNYWEKKAALLEAELARVREQAGISVERPIQKPARELSDTAERIRTYLKAHPCEWPSLREIGEEVGVSRERVRQLYPEYASRRRDARLRLIAQRLATFLESRPEAALPPARGGMRMDDLAKILHTSPEDVVLAFGMLGYPPRRAMEVGSKTPSKTIVGYERCWHCGKSFPWSYQQQLNFSNGQQKFKVCSQVCGCALRGRVSELRPDWFETSGARRRLAK